jgi:hypothetical protein
MTLVTVAVVGDVLGVYLSVTLNPVRDPVHPLQWKDRK